MPDKDDNEGNDNNNDAWYNEDDVFIEEDRNYTSNKIPEAPTTTFVSEEDLRVVVAKVQKAKKI